MVQVMLRQDNSEYACIAEDEKRYNLGEAKEELMSAMGLDTEVEGSAMQFLRRGYKVAHSARHWAAIGCRTMCSRSAVCYSCCSGRPCQVPLQHHTRTSGLDWDAQYVPVVVDLEGFGLGTVINMLPAKQLSALQRSTWWEDAKELETVDSWRR